MTVLFLILSAVLYRKYPSEAAGNALAFPRSAPVLKVLACIPGAFIITDMIHTFTGMSLEKWFFPLSILTVLILTLFVSNISIGMDLRAIWRGWKSTLISIAGVAAIVSVLQFDLIGYDSYMPDEDNVARISILPDSFSTILSIHRNTDQTRKSISDSMYRKKIPLLPAVWLKQDSRNAENGIEVPNTWEYSESESSDEKYMENFVPLPARQRAVSYTVSIRLTGNSLCLPSVLCWRTKNSGKRFTLFFQLNRRRCILNQLQ